MFLSFTVNNEFRENSCRKKFFETSKEILFELCIKVEIEYFHSQKSIRRLSAIFKKRESICLLIVIRWNSNFFQNVVLCLFEGVAKFNILFAAVARLVLKHVTDLQTRAIFFVVDRFWNTLSRCSPVTERRNKMKGVAGMVRISVNHIC